MARVPLSRFTPRVAASWKKKQLASGLSASTVRKHLVFVGAAMEPAVAQHLIAENPMRHVELPDDEPPPFHVYAPSEQAALLAAAAPGDGDGGRHKGRSEGSLYVPVVLDLATGLRRGELLGLRVTDVDLARSRLHVRQALRRGERGGRRSVPARRRAAGAPIVIPESVTALLAEYAAQRPPTRSPIFFLSLRRHAVRAQRLRVVVAQGPRPRRRDHVRRMRRRCTTPTGQHAGDELAGARFHDLRHTHATELLRAGVHIKVVAERLGDRETTVMQTYSHVLPDMQETAAAAIEPMMRGLLPR